MTYTLKNSSQTRTISVNDNTLNTADTSLSFIGKNYAAYGVALNQNFLFLLENFSNSTGPANPVTGQLWWNNVTKFLNIYDGTAWITVYGSYPSLVVNTSTQTNTLIAQAYITSPLFGNANAQFYGSNIFTTGNVTTNIVKAASIGNTGTLLQGTLVSASASQPNVTSLGTLTGLTVSGTTNLQGTTNGATINATSVYASTIGNTSTAINGNLINASAVYAGTFGNTGANFTGYSFTGTSFSGATLSTTGVIYSGGNIVAASGVNTISKTTGALVVSGGIGTTGDIRTGSLYADNLLYSNGDSVFGSIIANIANVANIGTPSGVSYAIQYKTPDTTFGGGPSFFYSQANGVVYVNSYINSTSTSTGAFQVQGGIGVTGNVNANAYYSNYYLYSNGNPIQTPAGGYNTAIQFNDGSNFNGTTYLQYDKSSGNLVSNSTTSSTTTTTGAVVINGGIGIGGALNVGGGLNLLGNGYITTNQSTATILATPTTINIGAGTSTFNIGAATGVTNIIGALKSPNISTTGNTYSGGNIYSVGNIVAASGTSATTTTTGALVVSGGIGLSGALVVGTGISMQGNSTLTTTQTTASLFNTSVTTLNIGGAATTVNIGTGAGVTNINNTVKAGTVFSLANTYSVGNIVAAAGTSSTNTTTGALVVTGGTGITGALNVGGGLNLLGNGYITTDQSTATILATPTTINLGSAATAINIGTSGSGYVKINTTGNSYGSSQGALQINGGFYAAGDSYIAGNLVVANLSSIGYNQLTANVALIYLQPDVTNYSYEIGFYSHKKDALVGYNHTGFVRNHSDNLWYLFSNIRSEPTTVVDLANANTILDTLKLGNLIIGNVFDSSSTTNGSLTVAGGLGVYRTIYAGSIQNTPIGNATPSTGNFTSIGVTGTASVGNITTTNGVFYPNGTSFSSPPQGFDTSIQFNDGGYNFGGATYLQYFKSSGNLVSNSTTSSTSQTTGAIVVGGGLGVGGNVYANLFNASTVYASTMGNTGANLVGTINTNAQPYITSVGTLTGLTVSGSGITGTLNTAAQTNITSVGTLTGLTVSSAIVPSSNASINLGGTGTQYFNNIYAVNFIGTSSTAKYADLAENYIADAVYEPGTVLDFGGDKEVTLSVTDSSTRVAGIVSTNPAYLMNSGLENENSVSIALMGRVPCKVIGKVRKGDMMISAGNGMAKSFTDTLYKTQPDMGSVIGKALENFDGDIGIIEVVVGRL